MARQRDNPWGRLVIGLTIITLGTLFWLDHLGRLEARDYLTWWPLAVIAMGVAHLPQRQWATAAIWIFVGCVFLLPLLGYSPVSLWKIFAVWPLLIAAAGLTLMMQAMRPGAGGGIHALSVMAGNIRRLGSQEFSGGDAIAVMGGCEIDLRSVRVSGTPVLDVLAFWGGIEIRVPQGWRVDSQVTTILGAYVDTTDGGTESGPRLVVRGSVIMGGLEVKNVAGLAA